MPDNTDIGARVAPYVSNLDSDVFALTGLPEEVIAVLFAFYSRSRDDLRTNLNRLLDDCDVPLLLTDELTTLTDKAKAFHEKWVVGYGHSSVAEHATVHLAVENVSIVVSKLIEDMRLGSFTEKSTRYVKFDTSSFQPLPELPKDLQKVYNDAASNLFRVYLESFPKVQSWVETKYPRQDGQTEASWQAVTRSKTCDLLRGLLPAGTKTNLGITANARALAGLLTKMVSHSLEEARAVGWKMHKEALTVAPTLLRHVDENMYREFLSNTRPSLFRPAHDEQSVRGVRLMKWDDDARERVILADAFGYAHGASSEFLGRVIAEQGAVHSDRILDGIVSMRGAHDAAPRCFEASSITAELCLDYGAYRDLQRHRMLSPFPQLLTCELGAVVSDELVDAGVMDDVIDALETAKEAWVQIAEHDPFAAQYVVPLAYRVRVLWTLNLREVFHVIELRSSKQGHESYRRIAQELYREVIKVHQWLKDMIRVDLNEYGLSRG